MLARTIGIGILCFSAFLAGMDNDGLKNIEDLNNIEKFFEEQDLDIMFKKWENDQKLLQEFDNEVEFYLSEENYIENDSPKDLKSDSVISHHQLQKNYFSFQEQEDNKEKELDYKDTIFEEKTEICEDQFCKKEYPNKTIHKIFYCEKPYHYNTFLEQYEVDGKKGYQCMGCKKPVAKESKHTQKCNALPVIIYLRYCALCDYIFSSNDCYSVHIKDLNCSAQNDTMQCPVEKCGVNSKDIRMMRKHFQKKHNEKDVLLAFKSKNWYKGTKDLKRKRQVLEPFDRNFMQKLIIKKSKKSLLQNIFERIEGICPDCTQTYINPITHKVFLCTKPYDSAYFVIPGKEKNQCTRCLKTFKPKSGYGHVYTCQETPLMDLEYCKGCGSLFRSHKQFSTHKKKCKDDPKSICLIQNCGLEFKNQEETIKHYQSKKHTEEAILFALQNKKWYAKQ